MSRNFDGGENLEENKDYRVYRYGDDLKPGYELKVEHSVSCENGKFGSHAPGKH